MRQTWRSRRKRRRRRTLKRRRGGALAGVYPPEPSNPIRGGAGFDTRYTFNQPSSNIIDNGLHGVSNFFNDLMGKYHSVSPDVLEQPYLK